MTAAPASRPRARWLLPDDGIIDPIAVEIAAAGQRPVALTWPERRLAAARILARGGTAWTIAQRLHVNYRTARELTAALTAADQPTATGTEPGIPAAPGRAA